HRHPRSGRGMLPPSRSQATRVAPGCPGSGKATRSGYQAWTIEVPCTLMLTGGSGDEAGPVTTAPLAMLNLLPWHGQLIVPPDTAAHAAPAQASTVRRRDAGTLDAGSLDAASLGSAMRETPQRLMPKVEKNQ